MNADSKKIMALLIASSLLLACAPKKSNASSQTLAPYTATMSEEEEFEVTYHTVKKGETLSGISKKYYGESSYWKEIAIYNNITDPDVIRKGQIIKIPVLLVDLINKIYSYEGDTVKIHTVQKGDTIYSICKMYYGDTSMTTMWKLATYNNLFNPNYIRKGQRLEIPEYEELNKVNSKDYSFCFPEPSDSPEHHHRHHHGHCPRLSRHR